VLTLPPGNYTIQLIHPEYQPIPRKVTIEAGKPTKVLVDFTTAGIPK